MISQLTIDTGSFALLAKKGLYEPGPATQQTNISEFIQFNGASEDGTAPAQVSRFKNTKLSHPLGCSPIYVGSHILRARRYSVRRSHRPQVFGRQHHFGRRSTWRWVGAPAFSPYSMVIDSIVLVWQASAPQRLTTKTCPVVRAWSRPFVRRETVSILQSSMCPMGSPCVSSQ